KGPCPPLKRKRQAREPAASSARFSKRWKRSSSIISISSNDDAAASVPSSSQVSAEYWSQQPDFDSDASDVPEEDFLALTQNTPKKRYSPTVEQNRLDGDTSVPEPTLCREQQDLLDRIMRGENVFFTGSAGCGKSTVLKAAVKQLRAAGKVVHITAPTGRAALGVNGVTTWSYMGWIPSFQSTMTLEELKGHSWHGTISQRLRETDVLVIDEISMVENLHLERINECMKHVKCYDIQTGRARADAPAFGGVQLLITGDFCQLPPVNPFQHCMYCKSSLVKNPQGWVTSKTQFACPKGCRTYREHEKWAFKSNAWQEAQLTHVHLNEIHRQSDRSFVRMLQKCRLGMPFTKAEAVTLLNHPSETENATKLLAKNDEVNAINNEEFQKLNGWVNQYPALDLIKWNPDHKEYESLCDVEPPGSDNAGVLRGLRDHSLEHVVELKEGALVMLRVNLDIEKGLVNGSQGIVTGWERFDERRLPRAYRKKDKTHEFVVDMLIGEDAGLREGEIREFCKVGQVHEWPIVKFHNGIELTIYPWCVVTYLGSEEPYTKVIRTQVPLTLGWALTIHKSQGMTLNRVVTNLSGAWNQALKYVALSRVTSLEGLKIEGGQPSLKVKNKADEVEQFIRDMFGQELFDRTKRGL
ncbi:atp-dependent dna helicase pif1, partial [Fusarium phyllophilum]